MNFLRDAGYIRPRNKPFITFDHNLDGTDLVKEATLTPIGELIIQMRGTPSGIALPESSEGSVI
jgi:hypothetical protein